MIIVKAPLRISIGGGGTDLPSYYEKFGSTFISAAINKYIYISIHPIFVPDLIIKYSEMERVLDVNQIRHPIVRECLKAVGITGELEISSFADIPAGTGLGSSGSFSVALLKGLYTYQRKIHDNMQLAEDACRIEIEKLGNPVGKQDQYISALGGLTRFEIDREGQVQAAPLKVSEGHRRELEECLMLFFTGFSRSANVLLKEQVDRSMDPAMLESLHFVKDLGIQIGQAIERGDFAEFGRLMNVHWESKRKRSSGMSSAHINDWYELAMKNGALGGKLIGAGGGGFLMFLTQDRKRLRRVMEEAGLREVPFRFDSLGAQVVLHD